MDNINNTVAKNVPSTTPQSQAVTIQSGQIWRDGHSRSNNRLLLVLDTSGEKVVCQSLVTGKIRSARREQFNRGSTGFIYASNLKDICGKYTNYTTNGLYQQPAAQPKDKVKMPDIDTRDRSDDTILSISFMNDRSRIPEDDDSKCAVQPYLTTEDDNEAGDAFKLPDAGKKYFAEMDELLSKSWRAFEEMGRMLAMIKKGCFYRETHPTFAAYCKDRLGMDHINNRSDIE